MSDQNDVLSFLKKKPNNKTTVAILHDAEEKEFPAKMPVLRIALVEDQVHLTVSKEEDINGSFVYTPLHQMAVDLVSFLKAVNMILDEADDD